MHKKAKEPYNFENFFIERAIAGDVEGTVALYESNATVAHDDSIVVIGIY